MGRSPPCCDFDSDKNNSNGSDYMNYKCSFCGKEYNDVDDYVACVSKCACDKKLEDERIRKDSLAKEKDARFNEVKEAERAYKKLLNDYIEDYDIYESYNAVTCITDPFKLFDLL